MEKPRFLLDTHVVLWWFFNDSRLSKTAIEIIQAPGHEILVSSAIGWEMATKWRLGKLPHAGEAVKNLPELLRKARMEILPITLEHALAAGSLPGTHRDPFDRMLIAQAYLEKIPIVTSDPIFRKFEITVIW